MEKPGLILASLALLSVSGACGSAAQTSDNLNSEQIEHGAIQTAFGIYLTEQQGKWGGNGKSTIVLIAEPDSGRRPASFADSRYDESDPAYDPKRRRLCFVSTRPTLDGQPVNESGDIWCTARQDDGWAAPVRLAEPINSAASEYSPSFDNDGNLYFASNREGGLGQGDIYKATQTAEGNWAVENLGPSVNSKYGEWNVGIHPDGQSMIFEASHRPENRSVPGDLYYSQWQGDTWSKAVPLAKLNSDSSDLLARWFDPDLITYASAQAGNGDVDHITVSADSWLPLRPSLVVVSRSAGEIVLLDPVRLVERSRPPVGKGPHEISSSADGRIAIVPMLGIYPTPHDEPIKKRPPFLSVPSEGVAIVDLRAGKTETKALSDCARPHGVASDAQARRVWITCEDVGAIIELESKNWTETRRYILEKGVHKVIYSAVATRLVATNPDTGVLTIISLADGSMKTLRTGGGAEAVTLSSDGQIAWVGNAGDNTVCRIRLDRMEPDWCVESGGAVPIAIAIVEDRKELWVSRLGSSDMAIFSAETGQLLAEIELESGALNLAVNAKDGLVYATLPRRNAIIAIDMETRRIKARNDNIMEGDDIDLVPAAAFGPQTDS